MEFRKLAEVELLDKAPGNATALAEVNGEVVRVKSGIGGGSSAIDLTDTILEAIENNEYEILDEGLMSIIVSPEKMVEIFNLASSTNNFCVTADIKRLI